MWQQGAAADYTNNNYLCSRKYTLREESSVSMKIFIGLKYLHAKLPGLTMLDFFSVTLMTRFGTYPIIHMQSPNMVEVRTVMTGMQVSYMAYDPKCFLFHERRMQKMCTCQWALF